MPSDQKMTTATNEASNGNVEGVSVTFEKKESVLKPLSLPKPVTHKSLNSPRSTSPLRETFQLSENSHDFNEDQFGGFNSTFDNSAKWPKISAPGTPRRATFTASQNTGFFSMLGAPPGLGRTENPFNIINNNVSTSEKSPLPVFQFFGGKAHSSRSFSFSAAVEEEKLELENELMEEAKNSQELSNFVLGGIDKIWAGEKFDARRSSFAPGFTLPGSEETKEMANAYFKGDPNLQLRRHSIAAALLKDNEITEDFAQNYGNFFDNVLDSGKHSRSLTVPVEKFAFNPVVVGSHKRTVTSTLPVIYVVEFKGGRQSLYFVPSNAFSVAKGDLVIVDGDRGKDLGKVTMVNVLPSEEEQEPAKVIHRLAHANEVNMLLDKSRDEAKALSIIQAKIKQKKLLMDVVDAEFQWDRKKLTFYYVSEDRVDFRELVKDLFKIFKTRIWMCSVDRRNTTTRYGTVPEEAS